MDPTRPGECEPEPAPVTGAAVVARPDRTRADDVLVDAVRRLRSGEPAEACFAAIDAHLRPRLRAYFQTDPVPRAEADDLVQKTLTRVYQGVDRLRASESFVPWLFTIARNVRRTAASLSRREGRVLAGGTELLADPPDPRPGVEGARLEEERLHALQAAIEGLPSQQRQCLLLRIRAELSYEEMAETLGLSAHTVRNHLAQARKNLRHALGDRPEEGGDGL